VLSSLPLVVLTHSAQTALLKSPQYPAITAVRGQPPIFDRSAGIYIVSKRELDPHNNAVANYMNWVEKVQNVSSFLKDVWFTNALVAPPMFEAVDNNKRFRQEYKFNRYAL
jgi:hypothetical protein